MANAILIEPLPFTAVRASGTAPGFSLSHIGNDYRGVIWRSTAADASYLIVDLGADVAVDTVALFGLWGNFPSATAQMSIVTATSAQGSAFNGGPVATGAGEGNYYRYPAAPLLLDGTPIAPGNGAFLWRRPVDDPSPTAIRYIYLNPIGMGAAGWIDVSRLVVGKALTLERNFSNGGTFGVRDLGSLDFSPRGVMLRRRAPKLRTAALTFASIYKDEVEAKTKPLLERIGNTEMVALVTDPDPHPLRQTRCYFGPLVGDLGHTHRKAQFYEAGVNVVSIF